MKLVTTWDNSILVLKNEIEQDKFPLSDDFVMVKKTIKNSDIKENQFVVKNTWLGFHPGMLKDMQNKEDAYTKSELTKNENDQICFGLGEVVYSKSKKFEVGDVVWGNVQWQLYSIMNDITPILRKINKEYEHPQHYLSIYGAISYTAYFGLLEIAKPNQDEVIVVSSAAGGVGQVVCQLAGLAGCHVIALTSSEEKALVLKESCNVEHIVVTGIENIDNNDLEFQIRSLLPKDNHGIDIYWDNVGGKTLDTVLGMMNRKARVVGCGRIASYLGNDYRLKNWEQILVKQILWQGILVTDYLSRFQEAELYIKNLVENNQLYVHEDVLYGLEMAPVAFAKLFNRKSIGKVLVKL